MRINRISLILALGVLVLVVFQSLELVRVRASAEAEFYRGVYSDCRAIGEILFAYTHAESGEQCMSAVGGARRQNAYSDPYWSDGYKP